MFTKTVMLRRSNLSAGTKGFCPQSQISHFKLIISISLVFLVDLGIKGKRSARISPTFHGAWIIICHRGRLDL